MPSRAQAPQAGAVFRPADETAWGGQTLVAPRPLYLTSRSSAKLSAPVPEGASVLYGALEGTAVAQVRLADGTLRVYLDQDGDKALTEREGLTLRKGVVRWPACADDLSAVAGLGGRTAVVWACRAPNVLFWAWRGFLQGQVAVAGTPRPAFLVDGNADGKFGGKDDLLWIDLNGDWLLDPVAEQFPCTPVLRIAGELYQFSFQPEGEGGTAVTSRVERGSGRRRVAFAPEVAGRVVGVEGTFLSQADDIIRTVSPGEMLEMPAGSYALTSMTLRVSPDGKPATAWTYTFSRYLQAKDSNNFPLAVESGPSADLLLYRSLSLRVDVKEAAAPGEELPVQLIATTEMGLELNNARRAGQGEQDFPEDFATISLLDPEGKVVEEKRTGFA